MNFLKITIAACLLFVVSSAMHCEKRCTGPSREVRHSVQRMSVRNLDNSGRIAIPASDSGVVRTAFGITLSIENEEVFFGSDTAFLPPSCGDVHLNLDSIVNIQITTVYPISSTVRAGEDVTGLFRVLYPYGEKYGDVQAAIREQSYGYERRALQRKYTLLLINSPEVAGTHQFRFRLDLSDGRKIEAVSREIKLL